MNFVIFNDLMNLNPYIYFSLNGWQNSSTLFFSMHFYNFFSSFQQGHCQGRNFLQSNMLFHNIPKPILTYLIFHIQQQHYGKKQHKHINIFKYFGHLQRHHFILILLKLLMNKSQHQLHFIMHLCVDPSKLKVHRDSNAFMLFLFSVDLVLMTFLYIQSHDLIIQFFYK